MRRTPKKSTLRNRADSLCSQLARSIGRCEWCGETDYKQLQWCHFITRAWILLRYNIKNWACLCASCHFKVDDNPLFKIEVWKKIRGSRAINWLKKQSPISGIITVQWYEKIIKKLNEELNKPEVVSKSN